MLICNYSYINQICGHNHSGLTNPVQFIRPHVMRGHFTPAQYESLLDQIKRDSFPTGTNHPYSIITGDKGGLISATTTLINTGQITANVSSGINIEATLNGLSTISTSNLSLIISLASNIASSGNITTASLVGTVALAATLAGVGSVTAGLNVVAFMQTTLAGSGLITADLKGKLALAATIYVNQSEATVAELVDGVWNALLADYNTANTMGEVMNNMGSVADPWSTTLPGSYAPGEAGYILGNLLANIPDSVWDELKASHTTNNSYGKIIQDLETLAKQIKGLTAAQL